MNNESYVFGTNVKNMGLSLGDVRVIFQTHCMATFATRSIEIRLYGSADIVCRIFTNSDSEHNIR